MADKLKGAMHGKNKRARLIRCLTVLVAVVALFAATASWAVADGEGKIQNLTLTWGEVKASDQGLEIDPNDSSKLTLTPQGAGTQAAGTSASARLTFTVANANQSAGTADPIEANGVEVRIPAHIFRDRSDNAVGTFDIGLPDSIDKTTSEDSFYYYWDHENGHDDIVIKNGQPINDSIDFDVTLNWYSTNAAGDSHALNANESGARNIKDGYTNSGIKATATVTKNGVTSSSVVTPPLTVKYNTDSKFDITKATCPYQLNWNIDWGTEPTYEDGKDSIYTVWKVNVTPDAASTQPYTFTTEDKPQDLADGSKGTVVYNSLSGKDAKEPAKATWTVEPTSTGDAPSQEIYYVVRYARPDDDKGFEAKNYVDGTLSPVDKQPKTIPADATLKITTLGFQYPGTGPGIEKQSYETRREGAINAINNAQETDSPKILDEFRYVNKGTMIGGALTLGDGMDGSDISQYGQKAYTVELTDDLLVLGDEKLDDSDYTIKQITLADRVETKYYKDEKTGTYKTERMKTGEWCKADPKTGEMPTAQIYVRRSGHDAKDYEYYGKVVYGVNSENDSSVAVSKTHFDQTGVVSELVKAYNDVKPSSEFWGNYRVPLDLPSDTVGVQIKWSSKNYQTSLSSVALVKLNPSAHVKNIVKKDGFTAEADLVNVNSMRVFKADGTWWKPQDSAGNQIDGDLGQKVLDRDAAMYDGEHKNAFHAFGTDTLLGFTGGTSISKGGRSKTNDDDADTSSSAQVKFTYNSDTKNYEGLYYLDAADWTSVSTKENLDKDKIRNSKRVNEQLEGTFYDLLPAGMTVDTSSVVAWKKELEGDWNDDKDDSAAGTPDMAKVAHSYAWREKNDPKFDRARCETIVELKRNWQGSGRTMMIVHVKGQGTNLEEWGPYGISNTDRLHKYYYSGFHVEFNAYYSRDAFDDHGSSFTNSVAYMAKDGTTLWNGYNDASELPDSAGITDKPLLSNLKGDGSVSTTNNIVFAQEPTQLTTAGANQSSSNKRVMDEHDTTWKTDTVTTQDGSYKYRLRMKASDDLTDLVFYDDIERHVVTSDIPESDTARWVGTFDGVETQSAERLGIKPKVYYSVSDNLNLYPKLANGEDDTTAANEGTDRDLSNSNIWVDADTFVAQGGKLSDVKAVAIDMSKDNNDQAVTIKKGQSVSVYIDMLAPTDPSECKMYHDKGYRAVNRWVMSSTKVAHNQHVLLPIQPVTVRVNAKTADFEFTKVDGSDTTHGLEGAVFKLFKWTGSGDAPSNAVIDASNPGNGWTAVDNGADGAATSDTDGKVKFADLVKGTYRLVETKAPGGYQLPAGQWQIIVDPTADAGVDTEGNGGKQFTITSVKGENQPPAFATKNGSLSLPNYKPFELPSSGEMGLMGLIAGALILACMGWLLVRGGNREA